MGMEIVSNRLLIPRQILFIVQNSFDNIRGKYFAGNDDLMMLEMLSRTGYLIVCHWEVSAII